MAICKTIFRRARTSVLLKPVDVVEEEVLKPVSSKSSHTFNVLEVIFV
jgi:hypothetical protein